MYKSLPAVICKYSPPGEKPLPINTVAYVIVKCHVPASLCAGPVLFEASKNTPLAGNPNDDNYDFGLPDFGLPLVITLSTVNAPQQGLPNGVITFLVQVSDYVHGTRMESVVS